MTRRIRPRQLSEGTVTRTRASDSVAGMSRQKKRQKVAYCQDCHNTVAVGPLGVGHCPCGTRVFLRPDNSVELHVTGVAAEVESVTRRLAAELKPVVAGTGDISQHPSRAAKASERWSRSRKVWAFAIGLTTIVGGIAAVLALFIH